MQQHELMFLAQLSAQRTLLVRLLVLTFLNEPEPVQAVRLVRELFRASPVQPPADSGLDPAVSDLLAGMTDEEIDRILTEVEAHLVGREPAPVAPRG